MRRQWRGVRLYLHYAAAILAVAAPLTATFEPARAQVPIPLQEQVQLFNSLPPAQQQALIRELQGQLPPAQRQAIVQMLQQPGGGGASQAEATDVIAADAGAWLPGTLAEPVPAESRLGAGDTLVIEFQARADAELTPEGQRLREEFRDRLAAANPFTLDSSGFLYLPGVPAIALAGLNAEQATTRLRAEPALAAVDVTVTFLPLEPVGTEALQPFGYDLFAPAFGRFASVRDSPVPVDYVIGPGDTVNIQLFGNQNAEYFLAVSREGTINFPQIGPLNVSGLSFDNVRSLINERVSEQMIGVRASVTLGELRSIRVFVLGDVVRPGSYTISSLATMTNALLESGGVRPIGSLRNLQLRRNGTTVATLDLYDLLLRGDTSGDARLQPGDAIFVPPVGPTVAIHGEVRRPALYELSGERSVAEVVALAGGLRPTANRAALKLERIVPGRGVAVQDLDLRAAVGANLPLQDGDVLRAQPNLDRIETGVRLVGNVFQPGLYEWRPGMRLTELLPSPELVRPMSDLSYVLIRRERSPNVNTEIVSADLEALWQQRPGAVDVTLEARDTVHVFNVETGRQQFVEPIIRELRAQAAPNAALPVVRVGGEVRAAGEYPLERGMRVSDLLRAGGGINDAAYVVEAELTRYRVVNGEYREIALLNVDMAAIQTGSAMANVSLLPYDHLNIKQVSRWRDQESVAILGEVNFPGTYPIRQGERLSSLLDRAGGLTEQAFVEGSIFTRTLLQARERELLETLARRIESDLAAMSLSDPNAGNAVATGQELITQIRSTQATGRLVIRLGDLLAGDAALDIEMQHGDRLMVPVRSQSVTVIGEVYYPASHLHELGLSRDDYLQKSGGTTARAEEKRIFVVRPSGEVVADTGSRWFRGAGGSAMMPGDTIVVPQDVDRVAPMLRWTSVTQVLYQLALAAAAVNSF